MYAWRQHVAESGGGGGTRRQSDAWCTLNICCCHLDYLPRQQEQLCCSDQSASRERRTTGSGWVWLRGDENAAPHVETNNGSSRRGCSISYIRTELWTAFTGKNSTFLSMCFQFVFLLCKKDLLICLPDGLWWTDGSTNHQSSIACPFTIPSMTFQMVPRNAPSAGSGSRWKSLNRFTVHFDSATQFSWLFQWSKPHFIYQLMFLSEASYKQRK